MKILIADDHRLIVDDLLDEVSSIFPGALCVGTSDPTEIIPLFKENEFDVIIMDIDMPEINGIELASKLLRIKPRTNIIYITGYEQFAYESFKTNPSSAAKPMRLMTPSMMAMARFSLARPEPLISAKAALRVAAP